jgi:hypothetical protein
MLYCYCVATAIICVVAVIIGVVLCIDCVYCTTATGVNPIAVDKYIISLLTWIGCWVGHVVSTVTGNTNTINHVSQPLL